MNGTAEAELAVDSAGGALFDNTHSYLMWGFGAQRCVPGLNAEDTLSGEILRGLTLVGMAN